MQSILINVWCDLILSGADIFDITMESIGGLNGDAGRTALFTCHLSERQNLSGDVSTGSAHDPPPRTGS